MKTTEGLTISLRRGQIAQEQVILLCHFTKNNITGSFRVSLFEIVMHISSMYRPESNQGSDYVAILLFL